METIEFLIMALFGAIIHLLMKYQNASKRSGVKFNWRRQVTQSVIGFLAISTIIYNRADFSAIVPITGFTSVILGYLGDSAFKNIVKQFSNKLTPNQ